MVRGDRHPWTRRFPAFPRFRDLDLSDRDTLRAAFRADPPAISEMTFPSLWAWHTTEPVSVSTLDGGLILLVRPEDRAPWVLPPVAVRDPTATALRAVEALAPTLPAGFHLCLASEELASRFRALGHTVTEDRGTADYVYRTRDLIDLPGKRYDAKRNWVRRCLQAHACAWEPIAGPVVAECRAFVEEWCAVRNCDEDPALCGEVAAVRETLARWDDLNLLGGVVRVDGRVRAFAAGDVLAPDTAVVHFEKADPGIPGLYQLVNHWFCARELSAFAFVNREGDLGNPGLRRAKQSYHPVRMVRKFRVAP